jgi:hypothetical protein
MRKVLFAIGVALVLAPAATAGPIVWTQSSAALGASASAANAGFGLTAILETGASANTSIGASTPTATSAQIGGSSGGKTNASASTEGVSGSATTNLAATSGHAGIGTSRFAVFVLRGTLTHFVRVTRGARGSVSIIVSSTNHAAKALLHRTFTFALTSGTKLVFNARHFVFRSGERGTIVVRGLMKGARRLEAGATLEIIASGSLAA